ncbi:MAG: undecaprenyl-phosphate glucose phosphotransferase [Oligoflexia bacterium]|nr:undecaprenyl-phosphate glucose phosphotransferase [Oligoflexia bacterium]MBF0365348.1 undecaprenyl-phosphate glucose phosphotransferase [Oligoflexia bacterium]
MTRHEKPLFNLVRVSTDVGVLVLAWLAAYFIRFESFIPGGQSGLLGVFVMLSLPVALFTVYILYRHEVYTSLRFTAFSIETLRLLKASTISFVSVVILIYFLEKDKLSRIALVNYFLLSTLLLLFTHALIRTAFRKWNKHHKNFLKVLLVGDGAMIAEYALRILKNRASGVIFVGWKDAGESNQKLAREKAIPLVNEMITTEEVDVMVIGYRGDKASLADEILRRYYSELITIQVIPDLSYALIGHEIQDFSGIPIMTINWPKPGPFDYLLKRSFDFISAFMGLLILSPILAMIALAVKMSSKGPIFYGQERVGLDGRNFKMWKFRSMKIDAERETGAVWAVEDDPRRTVLGTLLRVTSLDELPQLWNVLKGDMSLVGPRPERPVFVNKFKGQIPNYMLRHRMKAGITGWAQVNGWRGNTSLERRIECDIFYIKHWSLWLDIKILFLTFWKGFVNKNAY